MSERASASSLCQTLVGMWNEKCENGGNIKPVEVDPDKNKLVIDAWQVTPGEKMVYWTEVFNSVFASPFCRGEIKDFKASFTWAIKSHRKIMDGDYDQGNLKTKRTDELKAWAERPDG